MEGPFARIFRSRDPRDHYYGAKNYVKGVSSKPSGKLIVAPILCSLTYTSNMYWLLTYCLIVLNYAKFEQPLTNLILVIL